MQKYQARVIEWEVRGREIVSGGGGSLIKIAWRVR